MKLYHLISLGCPKNLIDSERFAFLTEDAGYKPTAEAAKADLIIINTCGFINEAKEEAISTILENAEYKGGKKHPKLIVTGCLVKRYKADLETSLPEVDIFIDLKDFKNFKTYLTGKEATETLQDVLIPRVTLQPQFYAYLRISDGCNNHCSYCSIPGIRGELTSVPKEILLNEVKSLAEKGVKELIINAQDTTQYGLDIYGKRSLIDLLQEICELKLFPWIRLLYLHPAHLSEDLIDFINSKPEICKYYDLPLQHINNDVLQSMNRKVTKERIIELIKYIRSNPEAVIRTTFITGYPGEDRKKYLELRDFIKEYQFDKMGVFTYSPEENTPAAEFTAKVTAKTAQNRKDELMQIQQGISTDRLQNFVNLAMDVIIEKHGTEKGIKFEGRSRNDAPEIDGTIFITKGNAKPGDIVKVKITDSWEYDLVGEIWS